MSGKIGSITTDIIKNGLVFNMDAANRASTIPSSATTKTFNTIDLSQSGSFINDTLYDSSTTPPSFAFDGTTDYINADNISSIFPSINIFSISIWAKSDYENLNPTFIASNGGTASQAFLLYAYDTNTGTKDARVWYNGVSLLSTTNTSLSGWNNFCFVQNGATDSKLYVNAIERASSTTSKTMHSTIVDVKIGGTNDFSQYFEGNIANSLIYTRALSSIEVLHNYNALKGRFGL